jgi:hypothetical protein
MMPLLMFATVNERPPLVDDSTVALLCPRGLAVRDCSLESSFTRRNAGRRPSSAARRFAPWAFLAAASTSL